MDIVDLDRRMIAEGLPNTGAIQVGHIIHYGIARYKVSHIEHRIPTTHSGSRSFDPPEVETTVYVFGT